MSVGRKYRFRNVVQIKKTIYTLKAKLVMFMERNLFVKLEQWKNKKKRKSLIIQGARRVGKTWIIKEFGARYFEERKKYDK